MKDNKNNLTGKAAGLFLILILFGSAFYFAKSVRAQTIVSDLRILYQDEIKDTDGTLIQDGKYNIKFVIYDQEQGGKALWEEDHIFYDAIYVKDGKFKIVLGRLAPLELNFNQPSFWLGSAMGKLDESNNINWESEMKPRKSIISLKELLREKGLEQLQDDGLTDEEWQTIFALIEEKLKEQPNLVILFDAEQLKNFGEAGGQAGSKLFDVLQNLITFISDKISQILEEISKIGEKIDNVSARLEGISSLLADIKFKIDVLYKIFVEDKGLAPAQSPLETSYSNKKIERMVFKSGEVSLKIFNQSIKENSLIFISFSQDPGSSWWVSEKIPGFSFNLSLSSPSEKDLIFDYWILNEETEEEAELTSDGETSEGPLEINGPETSEAMNIETESSNGEMQTQEATSTQEIIENPTETIEPEIKEELPLEPEIKTEEATGSNNLPPEN